MHKPAFSLLAAAILCAALSAWATVARLEVYSPDAKGVIGPLDGLAANGAAEVVVVISEEGSAALEGRRDGKVSWRRPFPQKEPLNRAKAFASAARGRITLGSQFPFSASTVIQDFRWDGRALRFEKIRYEDPSQDLIDKGLFLALRGDGTGLRKLRFDDLLYPTRYVSAAQFESLLSRGHAAALKLHRAGKPADAALRLGLVFELTERLDVVNELLTEQNAPPGLSRPARWVALWKAYQMPAAKWAPALNDYGYFLQRSRQLKAALPALEQVVLADPTRAAARLNLADTLWDLDRRAEAATHYAEYQGLMRSQNRSREIPARVPLCSDSAKSPTPNRPGATSDGK